MKRCFLPLLLSTTLGQTVTFSGTPQLRFEKIVGDMRGKGMENLSVAVTDDAAVHLLMLPGRVAVFGSDGSYRESQRVVLTRPTHYARLAARGNRVFVGNLQRDYPWVFSPERRGDAAGRFTAPSCAAMDSAGRVLVGDGAGKGRVQVFASGNPAKPVRMIPLPSPPVDVEVRNGQVAAVTREGWLLLYDTADGQAAATAKTQVGAAARAVAIGPDRSIYVAFNGGPDKHQLRRYQVRGRAIEATATLARSYMEDWPDLFPAAVPMTRGPRGEIWYGTDVVRGRLLVLDPKTDRVRQTPTAFQRPLCVGFGRSGELYVGGHARPDAAGPVLTTLRPASAGLEPAPFPSRGVLYQGHSVPVWGLLPDADAGVYCRVVEPGYRKGWPALTLKKVYRDGAMKPFVDFGHLYAVRRRFHPTAAALSMRFDGEGNIILAAVPLVSVVKLTPKGKILWEAGQTPKGGADHVDFSAPRDIAIDSRGNIWVADSDKHQVFCLSPKGRLLMRYGERTGVDDLVGRGFDGPSGVEAAEVEGKEFLYVGDAGNQRIVKYRLLWQ